MPESHPQLRDDQFVKRIFDLTASGLGLLLLSPLLLFISALIFLLDGRPIFFTQRRMGRFSEPFVLLKFRTMTHRQGKVGAEITVAGDSRITPIGSVLRKTKMDELPQLINVLMGHMSLVGPRPEVETYTNLYTEDQQRVLELIPGITDPASLKYFDESERLAAADDPQRLYIEQIMADKIAINLRYASRANVLTDMTMILKTIGRIFFRDAVQ